jgi:hypothetical protein
MFFLLFFCFWITLGSGECTVASCDTERLLLRVQLNCDDRTACLEELQFQKNAIVPTDGEAVFAERMEKDLKYGFGFFGDSHQEAQDAILRIPRDFDAILRTGTTKNDFKKLDDEKRERYTGEYTAYRIIAYQSGNRLLDHLKECYELCRPMQGNGERFCDDSFGSAVKGLQETIVEVQKQILPWVTYLLLHNDRSTQWKRFSEEKCLGEPDYGVSCQEELRELFMKESSDPSNNLLEFAANAVFSASDSNMNNNLKNITKLVKPCLILGSNMVSTENCREILTIVTDSLSNLTKQSLVQIQNNCDTCWTQCRAKCFLGGMAQKIRIDLEQTGRGILAWFRGFCVTRKCLNNVRQFEKSFKVTKFDYSTAGGLDRLDICLGLIVSILSACGAIFLIFYGKPVFADIKVALYIVATVLSWSIIRIVAYGFSAAKNIQYLGQLILFFSPLVLLILQSILFSVLLVQWIIVLLPETWDTRKMSISLGIMFVVLDLGFIVSGIVISALTFAGKMSLPKNMLSSGNMLLVSFLCALVGLCCVCCTVGLVALKLAKKEDRNALIKSLVLFVFILMGVLIRLSFFVWESSDSVLVTINLSLGEALISFPTLILAFLAVRVARMRRLSPIGDAATEMQETLLTEEVPDAYKV